MTRGRPRQPVRPVVFSVKLVLHPSEDDDLIAYLQSAPPRLRATLIKMAMRNGQLQKTVQTTEADTEIEFEGLLLG